MGKSAEQRLTECINTRESQLRSMLGRSTTGANFGLREKQLKSTERGQKDINLAFTNLEKAYDHICREEVWRCARERQVLEKFLRVMQDNVPIM